MLDYVVMQMRKVNRVRGFHHNRKALITNIILLLRMSALCLCASVNQLYEAVVPLGQILKCIYDARLIGAKYYMAVSHKDWEQPNSPIWLPEIDIDRGLDFPIKTGI